MTKISLLINFLIRDKPSRPRLTTNLVINSFTKDKIILIIINIHKIHEIADNNNYFHYITSYFKTLISIINNTITFVTEEKVEKSMLKLLLDKKRTKN